MKVLKHYNYYYNIIIIINYPMIYMHKVTKAVR